MRRRCATPLPNAPPPPSLQRANASITLVGGGAKVKLLGPPVGRTRVATLPWPGYTTKPYSTASLVDIPLIGAL